jgi:hypothetical protein
MATVIGEQAAKTGDHGKYAFVSYYNTKLDENGNVDKFHIEARYCDGMLSPSAVASFGILLYSLLLKAVVLSQHGVLFSGTAEYMGAAKVIQESLLNNNGPYDGERSSNTSNFNVYREIVREQATEMVTFLKNEMKQFPKAYSILLKLAEYPCSVRLIRGDSWKSIETDLRETEKDISSKEESIVLEAIDTSYIDDCLDKTEWIKTLAANTLLPENELSKAATTLEEYKCINWDQTTGTYTRT